jgi:osmotically-inducible protein OsmY
MKPTTLHLALLMGATISLGAGAQELHSDSQVPVAPVTAPEDADPAATAAKVTRALEDSNAVPAGEINVATHAGTIVLTGEVDSDQARHAATSVAEKAADGARVSNTVEVRPEGERSAMEQQALRQSAELVREVQTALQADARTASLGVTVANEEPQVIILQGLVPTAASRTAAMSVASKVKGVARIDNRLQLAAK